MFGNKKLTALAAILLAITAITLTGCGAADTEAPSPDALTEAVMETEAPTETTPEETETTEAETEAETEAPATEEPTTEAPAASVDIPTNGELLAMINSAFGIMTDIAPPINS